MSQKEPLDIRKLVAELGVQMGMFANTKNLFLDLYVSPDVPRILQTDIYLLRHLLHTLAFHGLLHLNRGGLVIEVTTHPDLPAKTGGDQISFSMFSRGAHLRSLPSSQVPITAVKKSPKGMLIDLKASRELARSLGGDLAVNTSTCDIPSFHLTLPTTTVALGQTTLQRIHSLSRV